MGDMLTADVEFYHDKTGLIVSREALVESLRKGPCGDPRMRLRREAVDGSLEFHPLNGGYAILSGRHRFYARETANPGASIDKPSSPACGSSMAANGACIAC